MTRWFLFRGHRARSLAAVMHVAVQPASPLEVMGPFSVLVGVRAERLMGSPRSPSAFVSSRRLALGASSHAVPKAFSRRGPPLVGFHSSSGFGRDCPSTESVRVTALFCGAVPLVRFFSLQRTPAQRIGTVRATFRDALLTSSEFGSPDALLPFAPPNSFESGRSWDSPFRAFLLPKIREHFRALEPS
jgi:hypothetical protein